MQLLFMALLLALAVLLIWYSGMRRMIIFVICISFIPYIVSIPSPYLPSYRLFCLAILGSAFLRFNSFTTSLRRMPCIWVLLLVLVSYLLTAIMDERLGAKESIWKAVMAYVDTFLMIAVGYFSLYNNRQLRSLNSVLIILSIVLSVYGILAGIIGKDYYGQFLGRVFGADSDFSPLRSLSRTRLTSLLFDPHLYGFFSSTLFTTVLIFNRKRLFGRPIVLVTLFLLLSGVFFSGSRSALMGMLVAITIYVVLKGNLKLFVRYCFLLLVAFSVAFAIPATRKKINSVAEIFTTSDGGKTGGSNRNMRERQLEISLYLFHQNPVWGNGFNYFNEVLKPDRNIIYKQGLLGAESYLFVLLIEGGMVQIVCIGIFFLYLLAYFLSNLRRHSDYALWGITILTQFLIVIFLTGAFCRWQFALPFVGLAMRAIVNSKYERQHKILNHRTSI